jgi:hypothetical protein
MRNELIELLGYSTEEPSQCFCYPLQKAAPCATIHYYSGTY